MTKIIPGTTVRHGQVEYLIEEIHFAAFEPPMLRLRNITSGYDGEAFDMLADKFTHIVNSTSKANTFPFDLDPG